MNYVYSNIIVSTVSPQGIYGSAQKVKALMNRRVRKKYLLMTNTLHL